MKITPEKEALILEIAEYSICSMTKATGYGGNGYRSDFGGFG